MTLPLFYSLKYRLSKAFPLKELIAEECLKYTNEKDAEENDSSKANLEKIENYIRDKIEEFGISSNGQCKYCSVFNISLASFVLKKSSLDKFMLKSIKANDEYSKIITSIRIIHDDDNILSRKYQESDKQQQKLSVSLNKSLLKHLPNLTNLQIKNVKINELDESISECKALRNIEFVNNQLSELPENLFNDTTPISQIIIDNNPIKSVPCSLFCIDSLSSIVLSRLNVETLPENWLEKMSNEGSLRSIHIAQTKLKYLPRDLVVGYPFLEKLTLQGISYSVFFSIYRMKYLEKNEFLLILNSIK